MKKLTDGRRMAIPHFKTGLKPKLVFMFIESNPKPVPEIQQTAREAVLHFGFETWRQWRKRRTCFDFMLMIHKWNGYVNNIRKANIFIQMPVVIKLSVCRGLFFQDMSIQMTLSMAVSIYTTIVQLILLGYLHDRHAANFTRRVVVRSFNMLQLTVNYSFMLWYIKNKE